ncbi:ubiquinone biosynthesis protein COQ11 [Sporobolomyces salmoneus]|uniref:ubiquinone biosynthesis protein COQ11 n=1 Tax=Sporobolomyces salmoneus TaxID=183962 RepID=UPI003170784B
MKICVFGGSGLVGSSIAKKAVKRGWNVVSVSRSGKPFQTPAGHSPAWVDQVEWTKGTPFDPTSYAQVLPSCDALVSTLGILLEDDYKQSGQAQPLSVLRSVVGNLLGETRNPLKQRGDRTYERMNRDSAIEAFRAFRQSRSVPSCTSSTTAPSPFVFISAEDIFRPFVPSGYIRSKRQAEQTILEESLVDAGERGVRPVFIRPSLIYHPHLAPASTLPATLFEATSHLHSLIPSSLHVSSDPSPLSPKSTDLPPAWASLARLFQIPPIHADAVGEAVCRAIERENVEGAVGVQEMRRMLGFDPVGVGA